MEHEILTGQFADALKELVTLRDMLRWGLSYFNQHPLYYGHGTDNAWDEVVFIACTALHLPLQNNRRFLSCKLTAHERARILHLFKQRVETQKPAAYLLKKAWFAGLDFYVDERVIVPRSSIGELITHGFEPWKTAEDIHQVLDLCCGSGCLGIAFAYYYPETEVDLVDLSPDALAVVNLNIEKFHLEDWKHTLLQSFKESNATEGISLYIHLPFCESLCTFCGCNKRITKRHEVEDPYITAVIKEWKLYCDLFPRKPIIKEIH